MLEAMIRSIVISLWPVGVTVLAGALLEWLIPWRQTNTDWLRWLHAAVLYGAGAVIVNIILPIGSVGVALMAADSGWGLLNVAHIPAWVTIVLGILILDFTQWGCHWTMHHSPHFWRIHRLHHSDEMIDTSTAFRFHPAETLLRYLVQVAVILVLGVPVLAVAISATVTLIFDVWEHTNTRTPPLLRHLSAIVITPDLHRLHHSTDARHQNSNLGTIFSLWDRLLGTYISGDKLDQRISFGLGSHNRLPFRTLADLILDPFRKA